MSYITSGMVSEEIISGAAACYDRCGAAACYDGCGAAACYDGCGARAFKSYTRMCCVRATKRLMVSREVTKDSSTM